MSDQRPGGPLQRGDMRRRYRRRRLAFVGVMLALGGAAGAGLSLALDDDPERGADPEIGRAHV